MIYLNREEKKVFKRVAIKKWNERKGKVIDD